MKTNRHIYRWLTYRLKESATRKLVVITGARQTGKTTLVKSRYPDLNYINLDVMEEREALALVRTRSWGTAVGPAVIDEAQKLPSVFDKVKWSFDEQRIDFSVLTGSSRILLMKQIQETLAGRAYLYDLWPLMASELVNRVDRPSEFPRSHRLLTSAAPVDALLHEEPSIMLGAAAENRLAAVDHISRWGGMPGLLPLPSDERHDWLRSYQQTFLERDLMDLVRLRDLAPFRTLQKLSMLRSGRILSFSELARDAGIAVNTARRFIEYLRISYQTILLQPWWFDIGDQQPVRPPFCSWRTQTSLPRRETGNATLSY